jgi:glycosyltransferase involved in cell wall biosynthesis
MSMKIAFFTTMVSESPWGGSEELWYRTARHALECGHQVAVVKFRWPEIPRQIRELQERGAWVLWLTDIQHWWKARTLRWRIQWKLKRLRIWRALASWKPDVVCISQGGTFDMVFNGLFTRFLNGHGPPYVVICQYNCEDLPLRTEASRQIAIAYLSRARQVAFVAERNLRVAERQIAAPIPNACVVRNPVNLPDFQSVPYPNSDLVKMANVARLDAPWKGQDLLLQALSGEPWRKRRWLLRFYGSGPDRAYLERLTRHYGMSEKVEFCGHVSDVRSIWADNHLLVMPSRSEGTPLSLVEAMICGRPSVVTDVGGNVEWIDEPSTGFVADAPSAESLNKALERAWEAQDRWRVIGQHAHQLAVSRVDPPPEETVLSLLMHSAGTDGARPTGLAHTNACSAEPPAAADPRMNNPS